MVTANSIVAAARFRCRTGFLVRVAAPIRLGNLAVREVCRRPEESDGCWFTMHRAAESLARLPVTKPARFEIAAV